MRTRLITNNVTAREDIGWNVDRVLANQSLNQQKQFLEVRLKGARGLIVGPLASGI